MLKVQTYCYSLETTYLLMIVEVSAVGGWSSYRCVTQLLGRFDWVTL